MGFDHQLEYMVRQEREEEYDLRVGGLRLRVEASGFKISGSGFERHRV